MTQKEIYSIEVDARKAVLKRLEQPLKLAKAQAEKDRQKRNESLEKLSSYRSLEEARELYGYDVITKKEFEEAELFFEEKENVKNQKLPSELAYEMLSDYYAHLSWEARILAENDEADGNA